MTNAPHVINFRNGKELKEKFDMKKKVPVGRVGEPSIVSAGQLIPRIPELVAFHQN